MAARRQDSTGGVEPGLSRPSQNGLGREYRGEREQVAEIQRARMIRAMVEAAIEHGAANATVAHVVARSRVSRRTFYEHFEDREACFLAAFDDALARIAAVVVPAYERPMSTQRAQGWNMRMRTALTALLELLDDELDIGRLAIVESLGAGAGALRRRTDVLAQIVPIVDEGRKQGKAGAEPPPLTAEGVVGGVLSILHARLAAASPRPPATRDPGMGAHPLPAGDSLLGLTNHLMGMIVLPYLGPAAASREIQHAAPKPRTRTQGAPARGDPLRELRMRLTYRTIRALTALAAQPDSSNRQVADSAGISDQGQISKLLTRLEGLGLLHNSGRGGGEPNAWTLTAKGREVHAAIAGQKP
jgi:AcrR family transcriptional regulator